MSGEIKYTGAATQISEDGALSYVNFKTNVPYRYIVNNTCQNDGDVTCDILTSVSSVRCMIDKGEVLLECILTFQGATLSSRNVSYISSVNIAEKKAEKPIRRVVVYYPDKDESLYEVAKRFDTTARTVANVNSLSVDVAAVPDLKGGLSGIRRLIIY